MLKLFRSIRKGLLSENKLSKYLVYALGEIILLVIGILIALAINNLNQDRIKEKNEQIYLLGLREEFQFSKAKLEELIAVNKANFEGAKQILEHSSSPTNDLDERDFSRLMYASLSMDIAFNPNNSLLTEMINSGNLKNISNPVLRILLTNWIATLEDIERQERDLGIQRERVLDLFRRNEYSLKTILLHTGLYEEFGFPDSGSHHSNLSLMESREFENNMLMFILTSAATETAHYEPLMQDLEDIQALIDAEIE
ncbi:hypothetical protein GCM10009119_21100 [Algoriphagus jejuensis]|uniref:PilJ/NarX-like methyl-accepting chemotaxis transducer n=1 Tax=Algoriphagus jejuensis TaxID=419934 RepID=A0ABN1N005_9BACT